MLNFDSAKENKGKNNRKMKNSLLYTHKIIGKSGALKSKMKVPLFSKKWKIKHDNNQCFLYF